MGSAMQDMPRTLQGQQVLLIRLTPLWMSLIMKK
jgi:hypothetical protein